MKKVRARAPLRLGLAGGGTDVSPYCDEHGGVVLNATIDLYTYATLTRLDTPAIVLTATDQRQRVEFPVGATLPVDGPLPLHCAVYNRIVRDFRHGEPLALALATYSDAPAGSGLGSSSALVVVMVRAFVELLKLPLGEYDIARLAYEIERIDLRSAGGRQDSYAAAFGGVNFMEFSTDDRVIVNPLRIKPWILSEIEASTIVYYTGVSRVSAQIIDDEQARMRKHDPEQLAALHVLRDEAWTTKECILRGDIRRFALSINKAWEAKKHIASCITNERIERVMATATAQGAYAAKVSGAGGGGFVMFFADPEHRAQICTALDAMGEGAVHPCHFTKYGANAWRIE